MSLQSLTGDSAPRRKTAPSDGAEEVEAEAGTLIHVNFSLRGKTRPTAETSHDPHPVLPRPVIRHTEGPHRAHRKRGGCPSPLGTTFRRVAIIGAAGYVGAALQSYLKTSEFWDVSGFDRSARSKYLHAKQVSSADIPTKELHSFDSVVFLGGLTTRKACESVTPEKVQKENVDSVVDIARRMLSTQLLIVASTGTIGEGTGTVPLSELDEPSETALDSFSLSMLTREATLASWAASTHCNAPTIVALRFGVVVGVSPSQRVDPIHVAMVRSALVRGEVPLRHPEASQAFLWIADQVRAIETIMLKKDILDRNVLTVLNLASFNAKVGQTASEVALITGAHVVAHHHPVSDDVAGFSLSIQRMQELFGFRAQGTQRKVVEDLVDNLQLSSREDLYDAVVPSDACHVCGSKDMATVVDLGMHPANADFLKTVEAASEVKRRPLHVVQCPVCKHVQLSAGRKHKVSHLSPSANGMPIEQFAHYVTAEVAGMDAVRPPSSKSLLEVTFEDESHTNAFHSRGWAAHIVSSAKVHTMGSVENVDAFDAILLHHVLEYEADPTQIIASCAKRMNNEAGRLYIETTPKDILLDKSTNLFDVVQLGHLNYFTAESFRTLSHMTGLRVVNWQVLKPTAVLVTLVRSESKVKSDGTFEAACRGESDLQNAYVHMREHVYATRNWLNSVAESAYEQGHDIVGYGTTASGMALLHTLLSKSPKYQFASVVDEDSAKHGTFCPATNIPVSSLTELAQISPSKPITMVLFSWNAWTDIKQRLATALKGAVEARAALWVLLPYPNHELVALRVTSGQVVPILTYSFGPSRPKRRHYPTLAMVSHFYNEELMMPYWIFHHAHLFDEAIVIDQHSTDKSPQYFRDYAPSSWRLVNTSLRDFDAAQTDEEVGRYEVELNSPWRISLTTTEFVVHPDVLSELNEMEREVEALRLPALRLIGNDTIPLRRFESLVRQRSLAALGEWITGYSRFFHRLRRSASRSNPYSPGRHGLEGHRVAINDNTVKVGQHGWIAKFAFTPWPESLARKLQISHRIPESDKVRGLGAQHLWTKDKMEQERNALLSNSVELCSLYPLRDDPRLGMAQQALYFLYRPPVKFEK